MPKVIIRQTTPPDGTVNVNKSDGVLISAVTVASGSTDPYNVADSTAVLKDTDGTTISTTPIKATESEDIVAPDGTVENSTGSYSDTVVSGGTLVLPDETINIVDEDGNPIDSITFPVYTDPDIDISSYCPVATPPSGRELMPTGQTTVYRTGDDADTRLINGRAVDFFTLDYINPFGNTNRFTDELGGTTYANDIVIDWSTYNAVSGKVLGITQAFDVLPWIDAVDQCLTIVRGSFSAGWRLPNVREMSNFLNPELTLALNYTPMNIFSYSTGTATGLWTSTTPATSTTNALRVISNGTSFGATLTKTTAQRSFAVRTFTVTGTTLS